MSSIHAIKIWLLEALEANGKAIENPKEIDKEPEQTLHLRNTL